MNRFSAFIVGVLSGIWLLGIVLWVLGIAEHNRVGLRFERLNKSYKYDQHTGLKQYRDSVVLYKADLRYLMEGK